MTSAWAMSLLSLPLRCCPPPPLDLWSLVRPRFCLLSKEEGSSFGFHLKQEPGRAGPVVCRVEPGTPAQHQGLREGDRILGVNNHVVECEDYAMVRWGWDSLWSRRTSHRTLRERSQSVTSLDMWGLYPSLALLPFPGFRAVLVEMVG